jgi:hypothetical protein
VKNRAFCIWERVWNLKEREMRRTAILSAFVCSVLMWTGCSTNWVGEAEQIVDALLPATANLITLVTTLQGDVSSADAQKVQGVGTQVEADLQLMQSLIAQYQKAEAGAQPALLNQIQTATATVETNLNGLLPALHITDAATQAKVAAVVGVLLSEVQSMAALVPVANEDTSSRTMAMASRHFRARAPLSASEFVSAYDAAMTAKTGNARLDHATAGLRIHAHGKFARWVSAGLLK